MCWRPFCYPQVLSSNVFNKHANNSIYIYIICKFWILELPNFTILAAHPEISINWDFPSYSESLTVLVSYSSVVNHKALQLLYLTFNSMAIWRSWVQQSLFLQLMKQLKNNMELIEIQTHCRFFTVFFTISSSKVCEQLMKLQHIKQNIDDGLSCLSSSLGQSC